MGGELVRGSEIVSDGRWFEEGIERERCLRVEIRILCYARDVAPIVETLE